MGWTIRISYPAETGHPVQTVYGVLYNGYPRFLPQG